VDHGGVRKFVIRIVSGRRGLVPSRDHGPGVEVGQRYPLLFSWDGGHINAISEKGGRRLFLSEKVCPLEKEGRKRKGFIGKAKGRKEIAEGGLSAFLYEAFET